MKNRIKVFIVTLTVMLFTSCYDRDVIDYKEFDHSLPKAENVSYVKEGDKIKLTWQFPANISDDFKRPLEVVIQVVENDIYRDVITIRDEKTSGEFTFDTTKKYTIIVKLFGFLKEEAKERGKTDKVYSEGQIIHIE